MAKNTEAAPPLPPASVDLNKLHDACLAGDDAEKARSSAVFRDTVATPPGSTGDAPAGDGDPFDGMTKPDLQERCRRLKIPFESDANVPRLKELLLAHPQGTLNPDVIVDEQPAA